MRFSQPELNWTSRPGSFENIVGQIIKVRLGNPHHTKKHGWATDHDAVANELDAYLSKICLDHGWTKYVQSGEGDSPPPTSARPGLRRSAGNAVAGAKILIEWVSSGEEAVHTMVSTRRASVCAACPVNKPGDMLSFFTKPVSDAIKLALNQRAGWKLETPHDGKLGVCEACGCPLKLKVHVPIDRIINKLSPETVSALDAKCWILEEMIAVNQ